MTHEDMINEWRTLRTSMNVEAAEEWLINDWRDAREESRAILREDRAASNAPGFIRDRRAWRLRYLRKTRSALAFAIRAMRAARRVQACDVTASDVEMVYGALMCSTVSTGHEAPIVRKLAAAVLAPVEVRR